MIFYPDLFIRDANAAFMYSDGQQRYGQFLINQFSKKYPEIVIPQEADCFYDDKKVRDFLHFIYKTAIFETTA
jgi:hypothetical protein